MHVLHRLQPDADSHATDSSELTRNTRKRCVRCSGSWKYKL